jgi:hypothetical protein
LEVWCRKEDSKNYHNALFATILAVDRFPDFRMMFDNPDFVKYAEAYGATGVRVSVVSELRSTLETAFAHRGVNLIVVPRRVLGSKCSGHAAGMKSGPASMMVVGHGADAAALWSGGG